MPCIKNCQCSKCLQANAILNSGKPKRYVPQHILNQMQAKRQAEQELQLWRGYINIQCPKCQHYVDMKIGPQMQCPRCKHISK